MYVTRKCTFGIGTGVLALSLLTAAAPARSYAQGAIRGSYVQDASADATSGSYKMSDGERAEYIKFLLRHKRRHVLE